MVKWGFFRPDFWFVLQIVYIYFRSCLPLDFRCTCLWPGLPPIHLSGRAAELRPASMLYTSSPGLTANQRVIIIAVTMVNIAVFIGRCCARLGSNKSIWRSKLEVVFTLLQIVDVVDAVFIGCGFSYHFIVGIEGFYLHALNPSSSLSCWPSWSSSSQTRLPPDP